MVSAGGRFIRAADAEQAHGRHRPFAHPAVDVRSAYVLVYLRRPLCMLGSCVDRCELSQVSQGAKRDQLKVDRHHR